MSVATASFGERPRFITFEGGEGAGKSTQIRTLADRLGSLGIDVTTTREIGGTPGADEIRALVVSGQDGRWDPLAEALLATAARQDHLHRLIRPTLEAGAWVLCDRFADSTRAYQGFGRGAPSDAIETMTDMVVGDTVPDLTLLLDLPVEIGLSRAHVRDASRAQPGQPIDDRFERMDTTFHERMRQGFLTVARREPERVAIVDASKDADAVADQIWSVVAARLGKVD